jgi:hypothetical protein
MKETIAILIVLSFILPLPVQADVVKELDPVEKELLAPQKTDDQRINEELTREMQKPAAPAKAQEQKPSSNWWKWTLGIVIIGGIAAAAGGSHGGGSGSGSSGGSTGNGTISW